MRLPSVLFLALTVCCSSALAADNRPPLVVTFLQKNCQDCHDSQSKKGGLDLTKAKFDTADAKNFTLWVKVHDRVQHGEMPPKSETQPAADDKKAFLAAMAKPLTDADLAREK